MKKTPSQPTGETNTAAYKLNAIWLKSMFWKK